MDGAQAEFELAGSPSTRNGVRGLGQGIVLRQRPYGGFLRYGWRIALKSGLLKRDYNKISALSYVKALVLPFLYPVTSERELGREI